MQCGYGVERLRHAPPQQFTSFPCLSILERDKGVVQILPGVGHVPSDFIKQGILSGIAVSGGQLFDPPASGA